MGATGGYGQSRRDGEAIVEGDMRMAKGEEQSDTEHGVIGIVAVD